MKLNKIKSSQLVLNEIKPSKFTFKVIKPKTVEVNKLKAVK
jgi:hypothetical protein